MLSPNHIAILAGGLSRRMGENKARLLFEQRILLRRLVDDAQTLGLKTLLCADDLDYPEIVEQAQRSPDLLDDKSGALSAIQPALETCYHLGERWLWVYACDSLVCPSELLPYFQKALQAAPPDTMMILPKSEKRLPLLGWYRTTLYAPLKEYLLTGNRRVMPFCTTHAVCEFAMPEHFNHSCNFNTQEEFTIAKAQYTTKKT